MRLNQTEVSLTARFWGRYTCNTIVGGQWKNHWVHWKWRAINSQPWHCALTLRAKNKRSKTSLSLPYCGVSYWSICIPVIWSKQTTYFLLIVKTNCSSCAASLLLSMKWTIWCLISPEVSANCSLSHRVGSIWHTHLIKRGNVLTVLCHAAVEGQPWKMGKGFRS